jgi:DNA-binding CsgD family transcriptional regulator
MALKMRVCLQPLIDRLKAEALPETCFLLIEVMDHHLANAFSSVEVRLDPKLMILRPREIQVCNLIVSGLTSKQIASILNVTVEAVKSYRRLIKKKLDLDLSRENMATWLRSLYGFETGCSSCRKP